MDNVVQNISIKDIIPSNFQPTNEEKRKIDELAQLVKTFGLLDPILVRPKNGKYEIVLGIDKYQAALIAKLNSIPAIIKEIDDETFSKYSTINNKQLEIENKNPNTKRSNQLSNENSDVINLSELSKIQLEYERDDLKMNNGQFNNNMNNNMINNEFEQPLMNQNNQGPAFGGRFFPSLEDEPTNMNMMGGINPQPIIPEVSNMNNNIPNNSYIDLTDLSMEKNNIAPINEFVAPNLNMSTQESNLNLNGFQMPQVDNVIPAQEPMQPQFSQPTDNIINLENLQNNNQPIIQQMNEPVSMAVLNEDFGAPTPMTPQFDMSQSFQSQPEPISEFNQAINMPQNDFNLNQPYIAPQVEVPEINQQTSFNNNSSFTPDYNFMAPTFTENTIPEPQDSINEVTAKDLAPVINTIKNLVSSLENFGYKINIGEEDLANSRKITIEVEK